MLNFTASGKNAAASLYLWELTVQCQIAERAFARLQEAARAQADPSYTALRAYPKAPIELVSDASLFIGAAGVIGRMLFASLGARLADTEQNAARLRAARRGSALRDLLRLDDLPTLRALAVRNPFETVDERIDQLMADKPSDPYVWLYQSKGEPPEGLVLKRFDPRTLTVSCLGSEIDLKACNDEIACVRKTLNGAYDKVRSHPAVLAVGELKSV